MKKIMLLGATGSIGTQTIDVVLQHQDQFQIIGLGAGKNIKKLMEILQLLKDVQYVSVANQEDAEVLSQTYPSLTIFYGDEGLKQLASIQSYDVLVNAVVGFRGLVPTLCAIEQDKDVALANKESLVAGGPLVMEALKKHQVCLYPIDSEHSAIFQCLQGNKLSQVDKLILTASGGSFRDYTREQLTNVTVEQALAHPNWDMGGRITIDSATMMNKGFEVIEAHYLFDIPYDQIEVILHRESIIHSMVQYQDSAIMAQLGSADMRVPIQYALSYPERLSMKQHKPFRFIDYPTLHFTPVDFKRYPLLALADEVGKKKGNLGAIMNAADEEAVALFLNEQITFLDIEEYVQQAVQHIPYIEHPTLEDILDSDRQARNFVRELASRKENMNG